MAISGQSLALSEDDPFGNYESGVYWAIIEGDFLDDKCRKGIQCPIQSFFACRIVNFDKYCQFARGESDEILDPNEFYHREHIADIAHLYYRHIASWWSDSTRMPPPYRRTDRSLAQALIQFYECRLSIGCEIKELIFTIENRGGHWFLVDVHTPWCWQDHPSEGPGIPNALRPVLRVAEAVLCRRVLAVPDPDLPPISPQGTRHVIGMTNAADQSCIGNPVSPFCTLLTLEAAMLRKNKQLWNIVSSFKFETFIDTSSEDEDRILRKSKLHILSAMKIGDEFHPFENQIFHDCYATHCLAYLKGGIDCMPGDIIVEALSSINWIEEFSRDDVKNYFPVYYLFRRSGNIWKAVDWCSYVR